MTKITAIIPLAPNKNPEILESAEKLKNNLKIIIEEGTNTSKNRNLGIKKARTDLIAFLDAHTILPENWPEEVEKFFINYPEIDIVGGPQLTSKEEPLFVRTSGYALSSIFGSANLQSRYKPKRINLNADERHLTSANLICKRAIFKKIKFDESIYPGEDPKFISDALKAGFRIAYSPNIFVYHKRRANFKSLIKQIFSYGRTRPKKEPLLETLKSPFFLIPSIFLIYLSFLPTLLAINILTLTPLIIYLALNIYFSIYQSISNKNFKALFPLPFIYLAIHLSYGAGFIYGLIKNEISKN